MMAASKAAWAGAAVLPSGGVVAFPSGANRELLLVGLPTHQARTVELAKSEATDLPFTSAIEVDVDRQGDVPWAYLLISDIDSPIAKGDVVHVRLWGRNVFSMTGSARLALCVEDYRGLQQSKFADVPFTVGTQWQCVDVPFVSPASYPAGQWKLSIRLGYAPCKVQFGGIEIRNYGPGFDIAKLPRLKTSYDGREKDAAWRKQAEERIETLRKGNLTLTVLDAQGKPVSAAKVEATLTRHAFAFGTAVSKKLLEQGPDADRYRETLLNLFSAAVLENDLKWPHLAEHGYGDADRVVDWLAQHHLPTRGHNLIWPSERWLPKQAIELARTDPAALRKLIASHITETVSRYRGRLVDWDVINEPYANHFVMDVLGKDAMVEWFNLAHAADPDCRLYLNDYEILESGDLLDTPHQRHYFETARYLLDHHAPLHGLGIQGHFGSNITSPENMLKILDRFASLGVRIQVTELDVTLGDESLRADYYRDVLITLLSHPAVDGITQWGFWEGSHWIPQAALYSKDWQLRPHGQVFIDQVRNAWHTHSVTSTDAEGRTTLRGFKGTYALRITSGGKAFTRTAEITTPEQSVVIRLE
jgi:GH35 family endo-1,4-beta-xylanase